MGEIVWLILVVFYSIVAFRIYHKIFQVYYLDAFKGILGEIIGSCFTGVMMTALTIYLWYIAVIVISSKNQSKGLLVVFVILAIIIGVFGYKTKKAEFNTDNTTTLNWNVNEIADRDAIFS